MIIESNGIQYKVSAMSGWQARLYDAVAGDVLKALLWESGIKLDDISQIIKHSDHTVLATYEYFVKFCLTTQASKGEFKDYNITQRLDIPKHYRLWLGIFNQPGFYEKWVDAYLAENKEATKETDQKKD
jgi:hypothetical protein